jgi:hypothetical protein
MIFLIEYSRPRGEIATYKRFDERDREEAANVRLALELELNQRDLQHEVVLLEADSEEALRRTHRRYFQNAKQIMESSTG